MIILPGGRVLWVELKRSPAEAARPLQLYWLNRLTELGCEARLIRGKDEVDQLLTELAGGRA